MTNFTFKILGTPAPGGSKSAFAMKRRDGSLALRLNGAPIINMVDAGKHNKQWRKIVAITARKFYQDAPLTGALILEMQFHLLRPKKHFRGCNRANALRADAPQYHTIKPDALKLARSAEDAMTGIIYADDSQNVEVHPKKFWSDWEGCIVTVTILEAEAPKAEPAFDLFAGTPRLTDR